jgi:hypothetical protein
MKTDQFKCALCKDIFDTEEDKGWNEEKRVKELRQNFGNVPVEECDVVCDDCYKVILNN